jgi:hypothetical protein
MSLPSASRTVVSAAAVTLVAILISIYIVSQFLRNSVGVIAPNLAAELALSPVEVGLLSPPYKIPVGVVLDRFGPRICLMAGATITWWGPSYSLRPSAPSS